MLQDKPFIKIAIDGFSACGKSTLAKDLARHLHFLYIDSGAMYRAVTWYCLQEAIRPQDLDRIAEILPGLHFEFRQEEGQNRMYLNGRQIEAEIRSMEVSEQVSPYSTVSLIRRSLVHHQRALSQRHSVVMDGRDIGTVVFPDADIKFFVSADFEVRAQRRLAELKQGFPGQYSLEQVRANLASRDLIDSTREDSPLTRADDAIEIDTTHLSRQSQLELALEYLEVLN